MQSTQTSYQLIQTPASNADYLFEQLGYIEAFDGELEDNYAYVAFKQTSHKTGGWHVRILSRTIGGALLGPAEIAQQSRLASVQGKPYFSWGLKKEPGLGDLRHIEFRVHVVDGRPTEVEILLQLLLAGGRPDSLHSLRFAWPAAIAVSA
jgi:hypothetical protein